MKPCNVAFQVIPKVPDHVHSYDVVDKAIEIIDQSGVKYEVGPMETTMEGDLDELLEIVKKGQEACIKNGATEVISFIKIHYRPSQGVTMAEKIDKYRP